MTELEIETIKRLNKKISNRSEMLDKLEETKGMLIQAFNIMTYSGATPKRKTIREALKTINSKIMSLEEEIDSFVVAKKNVRDGLLNRKKHVILKIDKASFEKIKEALQVKEEKEQEDELDTLVSLFKEYLDKKNIKDELFY
jgi:hypothetical protein